MAWSSLQRPLSRKIVIATVQVTSRGDLANAIVIKIELTARIISGVEEITIARATAITTETATATTIGPGGKARRIEIATRILGGIPIAIATEIETTMAIATTIGATAIGTTIDGETETVIGVGEIRTMTAMSTFDAIGPPPATTITIQHRHTTTAIATTITTTMTMATVMATVLTATTDLTTGATLPRRLACLP